MQQLVNILVTVVLAIVTIFFALGVTIPAWLSWILFVASLAGLVVSFFPRKKSS